VDVAPSLPAYAHVTEDAVRCVAQASARYEVPELLLHGILMKEGGRMGQAVRNRNGTYDLGLAQINTSWVGHFARYGIRLEHLLYDTCTNLSASAYILKQNYNRLGGDWFKAIVAYNIGPNNWTASRYAIGYRYAVDVVRWWWGFQNWVDARHGIRRESAPAHAVGAAYAGSGRARREQQQLVSQPPPASAPRAQ
jgi:soluble lytic murein transglycosylase-like protein